MEKERIAGTTDYDELVAGNGIVLLQERAPEHINAMNPASYTAVDSLSFIFDAGMSLKSSNFQEGKYKANDHPQSAHFTSPENICVVPFFCRLRLLAISS